MNTVVSNIIKKKVCAADCERDYCAKAHPNCAGSTVRTPKWCCQGWTETCTKSSCPFNHHRNEFAYVKYRSINSDWVAQNPELMSRYFDIEPSYTDNPGDADEQTSSWTARSEPYEPFVEPVEFKAVLIDGVRTYADVAAIVLP